jgi:rhodanese-related sulfurtransferase
MSLKILLKIQGQLAGELMLLDLMSFATFKIKAQRRKECQAPGCTLIKQIAGDPDNPEIQVDSLAGALAQGLNVIDIREADEIAARPSGVTAITMSSILNDPSLLPSGENIALLCASGKRSLATARELRRRGITVHSLAGGLAKVRA